MGVFGGNYFHEASSEDLEGLSEDVLTLACKNMDPYNAKRNYYEARAGESYGQWIKNGWIFHEDPLGWFHWYCRYHAGRRHYRDKHQILRWANYGKRWGRFARSQLLQKGDASNVVKQGLLQWSYAPLTILHGM